MSLRYKNFLWAALTVVAVLTLTEPAQAQRGGVSLRLAIDGEASFDETGVPTDLVGSLNWRRGDDRDDYVEVGSYEEEILFPFFDPETGFLGGTVGLGTFTFTNRRGRVVGRLYTVNISEVVGETTLDGGIVCVTDPAAGTLCVESDGFVIGGTGLFRRAYGGFVSASRVMVVAPAPPEPPPGDLFDLIIDPTPPPPPSGGGGAVFMSDVNLRVRGVSRWRLRRLLRSRR